MTDQAEYVTSLRPGVTVLQIKGEVDILNVADLRTAMEEAALDDRRALVVELTGVSYFDSQTLEILVDFSKRLGLSRRKMSLVAPTGTSPRRLLDISGISGVIPTYATIDEASQAIDGTRR